MDRLFIVTRSDLEPGAIAAQSCHGLRAFAAKHPEIDEAWHRDSNNLVILAVPDEAALLALEKRMEANGFASAIFREPDFGDEATSLAIEPKAWRLLSSLPLALKTRQRVAASAVAA